MKKILCFGDSNTWGHNPADCLRLVKRWPAILRGLLPECEITEDGVCGRAVKNRNEADDPTYGMLDFEKKYIKGECDFDLVIIMLGTNDLLCENHYGVEETSSYLRGMIKELKGKEKTPEILLAAPVLIREEALRHPIFSTLYDEKSVKNSKMFGRIYKEMAEKEGVYFIDASMAAHASETDGVHLEPSEHEKLAAAMALAVKSILFRKD